MTTPRSFARSMGFMRRAGFRTESASDVRSALKEIRQDAPTDSVRRDPAERARALDVCRTLNNEASAFTTPVLFISANEDTPTKVKGFEVGGVDTSPSPSSGRKPGTCVRTHLRLKRAYDRLPNFRRNGCRSWPALSEPDAPARRTIRAVSRSPSCQVAESRRRFLRRDPQARTLWTIWWQRASGHDLAALSGQHPSRRWPPPEYAGPLNLPIENLCAHQQLASPHTCRAAHSSRLFTRASTSQTGRVCW